MSASSPSLSTLEGLVQFRLKRALAMRPGTLGQVCCITYNLRFLDNLDLSLTQGDPLIFLNPLADGTCFWVLSRHGTHWIDADFFGETK